MTLTKDEEARIAEIVKLAASDVRQAIDRIVRRYQEGLLAELLYKMSPYSGLMRANYSGDVYGAFEDGLATELGTQWSWLVPDQARV